MKLGKQNQLLYVSMSMVVLLLATSCVNHIKPYTPKRREYELPVPQPALQTQKDGSIFSEGSIASRLMTDPRAQRVNDVVIISINEKATAQRDTSTESGRDDNYSAQINDFLGLIEELEKSNPNFNAASAISVAHKNKFKGEGRTSRSDRFEATVPAMVRQVLPNGQMFVEGHRVVLVNNEEHHFYISGVIRPEDIDGKGSVPSSKIADAQIEFVGRGELTSGSSKGWLSKLLDIIWPF